MIDRSRRRAISLRISVTDRCQMRCLYCTPPDGVPIQPRHEILRFEEIVRFVRAVKSVFGLSKVHVTGGEPLVRSGIVDLVAMLAAEHIQDLALTTNGQHLGPMGRSLKAAGLGRVNVSLDSLNERTYASLTRGGKLTHTLEGIDAAVQEGFAPVKLNTVVLRGCNDAEVTDMARWAMDRGCRIRFLELMPIGCAKKIFEERFVPCSEVRESLQGSFRLDPLPHTPGQSSRNFLARDSRGRTGVIGFITAQSQPFCRGCRRLRLTSTGQLVSCLAQGEGVDVRSLLRSDSKDADRALSEILTSVIAAKGARAGFDTPRAMTSVGG